MLFALLVASQLREWLGAYLAEQWQAAPSSYGFMVAYGALFLALWIALSVGIQLTYRPAPLLSRYPVLDEVLGGVLGVVEGMLLLVIVVIVTDPYFLSPEGQAAAGGEFGPIRWLHDLFNDSLVAGFVRDQIVPNLFVVLGFLFPKDVVDTFRSSLTNHAWLA
jgi:hypothetical protein